MSKKLLRRSAVEAKTGCSKSFIYELMAEDKFPRPVRISPGRVGWLESDIDDWIASIVNQSRTSAATAA